MAGGGVEEFEGKRGEFRVINPPVMVVLDENLQSPLSCLLLAGAAFALDYCINDW